MGREKNFIADLWFFLSLVSSSLKLYIYAFIPLATIRVKLNYDYNLFHGTLQASNHNNVNPSSIQIIITYDAIAVFLVRIFLGHKASLLNFY